MQVEFTPEQEAQLSEIAGQSGTRAEELVKEAALRLLEEETRFRGEVAIGIAAADRGEFVEHEQVWKNVQAILH